MQQLCDRVGVVRGLQGAVIFGILSSAHRSALLRMCIPVCIPVTSNSHQLLQNDCAVKKQTCHLCLLKHCLRRSVA